MLGTSVLRYPAAHILNAAALELLLGVVIMGWGAECVCVCARACMRAWLRR